MFGYSPSLGVFVQSLRFKRDKSGFGLQTLDSKGKESQNLDSIAFSLFCDPHPGARQVSQDFLPY
jgi:hypothetical protein